MRLKYTTAPSLTAVDLDKLLLDGKRFVILDIDNTVTEWRSMDISKEVLMWAQNATQKGMTLFLLSNNHDYNRSSQLAQKLGAKWCKVPHKKPSQKAFECALDYLGATVEQTVMIGDQLYGDMLGCNRCNIAGILLDPISSREAPITRILRVWERLCGRKVIFRRDNTEVL